LYRLSDLRCQVLFYLSIVVGNKIFSKHCKCNGYLPLTVDSLICIRMYYSSVFTIYGCSSVCSAPLNRRQKRTGY